MLSKTDEKIIYSKFETSFQFHLNETRAAMGTPLESDNYSVRKGPCDNTGGCIIKIYY